MSGCRRPPTKTRSISQYYLFPGKQVLDSDVVSNRIQERRSKRRRRRSTHGLPGNALPTYDPSVLHPSIIIFYFYRIEVEGIS